MDTIKANMAAAGGGGGGSKMMRVRNRAPASIQITAEQILLEARQHQVEVKPEPRQMITDPEELKEYRTQKRKEFEDRIRMERYNLSHWVAYARWEEGQKEFDRARSVLERALEEDGKDQRLWSVYTTMEMRHKFVNRARNLFDRVTTILPRVNKFWYDYTMMEEKVGNINNAREVFERWMQWEPHPQAWLSYANLEVRQSELDRARAIYERYVACHPSQAAYLRLAKWEERQGQAALARHVYQRGLEELLDEERDEAYYTAFAMFEVRSREYTRARTIFKFALEKLGRDRAKNLYQQYVSFEKQYGDREGVESVIIAKRRDEYEKAVAETPHDYDAWFDLLRLEEAEGDVRRVRSAYERAVANVPPIAEKRFWRRYIYLWLNYAAYEELDQADRGRARKVLAAALKVVPHKQFTFAKLWLHAAKLEVRDKDLAAARKLLGRAIGMCPKEKLFRQYIELEMQLCEVDRCRTLFGKWLESTPHNCAAWSKFAELERTVGETERARAVYEAAVGQPVLDMPDVLWKAYIDFEIEAVLHPEEDGEEAAEATPSALAKRQDWSRVRALYRRLLDRTSHVKVWLSFSSFEASTAHDPAACRAVLKEAYELYKRQGQTEPRALVVEAQIRFEEQLAAAANMESTPELEAAQQRRPERVRRIREEDGERHEYYDYVFPDDKKSTINLKVLQKAHAWRRKMEEAKAKAALEQGAGEAPAAAPTTSGSGLPAPAFEEEEEAAGDGASASGAGWASLPGGEQESKVRSDDEEEEEEEEELQGSSRRGGLRLPAPSAAGAKRGHGDAGLVPADELRGEEATRRREADS